MKKISLALAAIFAVLLVAYGAGTTVNGTRTINGDLTVKGTCTGCGSAGLNLIEQHSASTSSSLNFTTCITSTYDEYEIDILNLVPTTNNVNILFRVSTDGGMTYDSGNNYAWAGLRNSSTGSALAGAGIVSPTSSVGLDGNGGVSNSSTYGMNGTFKFFNPGSGSLTKGIDWSVNVRDNGNEIVHTVGGGRYLLTTAVNAFQLLPSGGGTLATGTARCYGLAK